MRSWQQHEHGSFQCSEVDWNLAYIGSVLINDAYNADSSWLKDANIAVGCGVGRATKMTGATHAADMATTFIIIRTTSWQQSLKHLCISWHQLLMPLNDTLSKLSARHGRDYNAYNTRANQWSHDRPQHPCSRWWWHSLLSCCPCRLHCSVIYQDPIS